MLSAILRRLTLAGMTVLAGGLISATLVRYAPGFGADERQLDPALNSASLAVIRNANLEERTVFAYYGKSLERMTRADLGISRSLNRPVSQLLAERVPTTLVLTTKALALAWFLAVFLVTAAWMAQSPALELWLKGVSGSLLSLPAAVLALLSILMNCPGYFPLALIAFPKLHRYLGNLVTSTGEMPHLMTAQAKGVSRGHLLAWHVAPVIRREVLALAGVSIGVVISAAIPVEALCGIAGIGQLAWQSALARDLPLLINISMLVIACVVLANAGADLLSEDRRGQP